MEFANLGGATINSIHRNIREVPWKKIRRGAGTQKFPPVSMVTGDNTSYANIQQTTGSHGRGYAPTRPFVASTHWLSLALTMVERHLPYSVPM